MNIFHSALEGLSAQHRAAIEWFHLHQGQEVAWPAPLPDGTFLVNKAKGIHKPEGWTYALSIRQSLDSPYTDDDFKFNGDGSWDYRYSQEGTDPNYFTNKALFACVKDQVPVGVLQQVKAKPNPRYKVIGIALVTEFKDGIFSLKGIPQNGIVKDFGASKNPNIDRFDPTNVEDARRWIETSIVRRQGQGRFRAEILDAYAGKCAITGCEITEALEAAHIVPYQGDKTNVVENGLLLRADLHTLFDLGLIAINDQTMSVILSSNLLDSFYSSLQGIPIRLPAEVAKHPSRNALMQHRKWSCL